MGTQATTNACTRWREEQTAQHVSGSHRRAITCWLLGHTLGILGPVGVSLVVFSAEVFGLPVDVFSAPVSVECEDQRICAGAVRAETTLGRYTGMLISQEEQGKSSISIDEKKGGLLQFTSKDSAVVTVGLSWDGDPHPRQLSGSGLNCVDLTRQGGSALILSAVTAAMKCPEGDDAASCKQFSIEARVYDAQDPTGQRFSASLIARREIQETDILIPFSNFTLAGPRGRARFTCAGAVTVTFLFEGIEEAQLSVGPVYTDGSGGLTPIPTPTPEPTRTEAAPTATVTPTATSVLTKIPTALGSPTSVVMPAISETPSRKASIEPTQRPQVVTPAPRGTAPAPRPQSTRDDAEEVVYGEVVGGTR